MSLLNINLNEVLLPDILAVQVHILELNADNVESFLTALENQYILPQKKKKILNKLKRDKTILNETLEEFCEQLLNTQKIMNLGSQFVRDLPTIDPNQIDTKFEKIQKEANKYKDSLQFSYDTPKVGRLIYNHYIENEKRGSTDLKDSFAVVLAEDIINLSNLIFTDESSRKKALKDFLGDKGDKTLNRSFYNFNDDQINSLILLWAIWRSFESFLECGQLD
jgi:hypothetical protein